MTASRGSSARAGGVGPAPRRLAVGAGWGVTATLVMSAAMLIGMATGSAPMPKPIPVALVANTLGELPTPALLALGVMAHLVYGGLAGAVLAGLTGRATRWLGLGYGFVLWLLMNLVWFPYLGWGLFGMAVTPRIAVATLVLHIIYGVTLGLLLDRHRALSRAQ